MRFDIEDFRDEYQHVVDAVIAGGRDVAPRGIATREVLDAVLVIQDPTNVLLTGIGRRLNTRLAALESLQVIGGFIDPQLMVKAAPGTEQFMDHGAFLGAYGPRIRAQLPKVVQRLRDDPHTRQAVLTIWDPLPDLHVDGIKDYPCTVFLQFLIRDDKLVMHTSMRSNDLWWGVSYDVPMFTALQLTIANVLGIEPGPYHHHAVSMHVYKRDFEAIAGLHPPTGTPITLLGVNGLDIEETMRRARRIATGEFDGGTKSEQWYADQMKVIRAS